MPKSRAQVLRGTPRNLARLAKALRAGHLVAVPTETVYGLAGDARSPAACRRIFKAKGRPTHDPLIVHIHRLSQWEDLADVNEAARKVAAAFWPGPLTIVLPKKACVPDLATSGLPSVAVRMPSHPLFRRLLRLAGIPLAAPSANPFGYISPTEAAHVSANLGGKIPFILDGGRCAIGVESTILDLRDPARPAILRPGAISGTEISRVLKRSIQDRRRRVPGGRAAIAPGLLSRHYSPGTPLTLHSKIPARAGAAIGEDDAILYFYRPAKRQAAKPNVFWLAEKGHPEQGAKTLFSVLRTLDRGNWRRLHAERAPGKSALAIAINDRLGRAAAKR